MADKYMSMRNLLFWLFEVHKAEELFQLERFNEYDREAIEMFLKSLKDFADTELFPFFTAMDQQPVSFENGQVIAHPQLETIIKKAAELGWLGPVFDYDFGGMQIPETIFLAGNHILEAANNSAVGYLNLTTGSANLILSFGNDLLKETYIPKMISGAWMGTMALTEPQSGSSLSFLKTSAEPTDEGFYKIEGQKIFISGGDHQFAENFVHLTLARIKGAPEGTKGISLFVVPKFRPTQDGGLEPNDVITAGDFQKMGQRGYATTHLVFGENDNCHGWLVGEPHQGLKYMFQMMNAARIDVGATAASTATAAYYASLNYAGERKQGLPVNNPEKTREQTLIINHPDVKRMLLLQKAITEGAMSLLFECARLEDMAREAVDNKNGDYHMLVELLTPIAKTYPAEAGQRAINNGLQVLGGYGYCTDFPLQQYYRDIRIMSIYEGTTGIQSMDLLGRKMMMKNGRAVDLLVMEIEKTIHDAIVFEPLKSYAKVLGQKLRLTDQVLRYLTGFARQGDLASFLADATVFMEFAGTLVIAWQWLKIATVAARQVELKPGDTFYLSKMHTMKFFYKYELPKMEGLALVLQNEEQLTTGEGVKDFL
jgi:alkylation response protein AidB-like acyl-CoA dehydrogenase